MTNKNDERILELKRQIEEKKSNLEKIPRFAAITNYILSLDEVNYNLHTQSKEQLIHLLVKLNSYSLSAKDLGILDTYMISGYLLTDWIADIKSKLAVLSKNDEEKKLKSLETKLTKMLSTDKKVELELDALENLIQEI